MQYDVVLVPALAKNWSHVNYGNHSFIISMSIVNKIYFYHCTRYRFDDNILL